MTIWNTIDQKKLTAYEDITIPQQLMAKPTTLGSIVDKNYDETLDSHTWTLSNGVKVLLKKTDFKEDSIIFSAISAGGSSLASDELLKQTLFDASILLTLKVRNITLVKFMDYYFTRVRKVAGDLFFRWIIYRHFEYSVSYTARC